VGKAKISNRLAILKNLEKDIDVSKSWKIVIEKKKGLKI
jgi:hypothetical protein